VLPTVSLDELLRLPSSLEMETSRVGGRTRAEWHARFTSAEADLAKGKTELEQSLDEMAELASKTGNWKVSSPLGNPGGGSEGDINAPLNYGLKQDIKRKRVEVERAERALLDLKLEANLAGVPDVWYSPE
jgi:hypothetical protein